MIIIRLLNLKEILQINFYGMDILIIRIVINLLSP
nr:MAG TPA: hypothetical protein [Bacteriophage sp.]